MRDDDDDDDDDARGRRETNARVALDHLAAALRAHGAMASAMRRGFLRLALRRRFHGEPVTSERRARARVRIVDGRVVLVRVGRSGRDEVARAFEEALARAAETVDARARAAAALARTRGVSL